jgi:hypothetical protein
MTETMIDEERLYSLDPKECYICKKNIDKVPTSELVYFHQAWLCLRHPGVTELIEEFKREIKETE